MENSSRHRGHRYAPHHHHLLLTTLHRHPQNFHYQSRPNYFVAPPHPTAAVTPRDRRFHFQKVDHRLPHPQQSSRPRAANYYQNRRENHQPLPNRLSNHRFQFLAEEETLIIDLAGGEIRTRLTEETISKHLKIRTFCPSSNHQDSNLGKTGSDPDEEAESCAICLSEYGQNDTVGILHCRHEYHSECLKKWLMKKNVCPVCNRTALPGL